MNVEKHIEKLESLLVRIRRNADAPRTAPRAQVAASVATSVVESKPFEIEAPMSSQPATARAETPPAAEASLEALPVLDPVRDAAPEIEDIDMMDEEIVEVPAEAAGVSFGEASLDSPIDLPDEPMPESAPRVSMPDFSEEVEIEPPVKTPPPESGRQYVSAAPAPAINFRDEEEPEEADLGGISDVDALLEADMSDGHISKAPPGMPSMEQLGETVEFEGGDALGAELELAHPPSSKHDDAFEDELELSLPKREFAGGFDQSLAAPAEARQDLERHRRDQELRAAVSTPASLASPPFSVQAMPAVSLQPIVVERPPVDTHVTEVVARTAPKLPATFIELLDGSLGLKA